MTTSSRHQIDPEKKKVCHIFLFVIIKKPKQIVTTLKRHGSRESQNLVLRLIAQSSCGSRKVGFDRHASRVPFVKIWRGWFLNHVPLIAWNNDFPWKKQFLWISKSIWKKIVISSEVKHVIWKATESDFHKWKMVTTFVHEDWIWIAPS